jgi:hypothetical protein
MSEAEKGALLQPACRGESVAGAADYRGGGTPHRIVIIDPLPEFSLPGEWRSQSVADTQLVGCATLAHSVIGSCPYINRGSVERWRYTISIEVRAAATGERVASTEISADPPPCPSTIGSNRSHIGGLSYDKLEAWLAPILTGSAQP